MNAAIALLFFFAQNSEAPPAPFQVIEQFTLVITRRCELVAVITQQVSATQEI